MPNKAHGGAGWKNREDSQFEIGDIWKRCGVYSESDTLRSVILRRPEGEIENIKDPNYVLWNKMIIPEIARAQHDLIADVYKRYDVEVNYIVDADASKYPNIFFVRDLFTMTPYGAMISRMASPIRAGEEVIIQKTLSALKVPIIASAFGDMYFEGPDIMIVNKDLVFLGVGLRTCKNAVAFVKYILQKQGFQEVIEIQSTFGCGHLDGVVNILNRNTAVVVSTRFSYLGYEALKRHGYTIIELTDIKEVDKNMAINFVSINSETILINKNAQKSINIYKKHGIKCEEVDVSELMNGGGSVHCMTGVLWRGE